MNESLRGNDETEHPLQATKSTEALAAFFQCLSPESKVLKVDFSSLPGLGPHSTIHFRRAERDLGLQSERPRAQSGMFAPALVHGPPPLYIGRKVTQTLFGYCDTFQFPVENDGGSSSWVGKPGPQHKRNFTKIEIWVWHQGAVRPRVAANNTYIALGQSN